MRTDLIELKNFLDKEFISRAEKKKSYSKRAFSRDLGLSPTVLNEFLAGKRDLNFKNIDKIFSYLNKNIYCSWCDEAQKEVRFLIGGPRRQFICDKCLDECQNIIKNDRLISK
jgi:transcriptional regulator with XRE-family HTH domain